MQENRILVAGGVGYRFAVVRLTADGTLDHTFGTEGWHIDWFGNPGLENAGQALAVQPWDHKIVVAGYAQAGDGGFDFGVARLDRDGRLDPNFDRDGRKNFRFSNDFTDDRAYTVVLQADRKVVVSGFNQYGLDNRSVFGFASARLTEDGTLDRTFGSEGKQSFLFADASGATDGIDDKAFGVALQRDGKVILVGHAMDADGNMKMALARLEADPKVPPLPLIEQPLPAPSSVVGIRSSFPARLNKPIAFQRLLNIAGALDPHEYSWTVTRKMGKKQRRIAQGSGPNFTFRPRAPGTYTVGLAVEGVLMFSTKVRV
jgi:uncharacterized delta-60 repeat protein